MLRNNGKTKGGSSRLIWNRLRYVLAGAGFLMSLYALLFFIIDSTSIINLIIFGVGVFFWIWIIISICQDWDYYDSYLNPNTTVIPKDLIIGPIQCEQNLAGTVLANRRLIIAKQQKETPT